MTYISMNNGHMSHVSAQSAQTNCSCACTTSMHSASAMIMTMDARIMASIIISLIRLLALRLRGLLILGNKSKGAIPNFG